MTPIPCPHYEIAIVKRSEGRSAVRAAAYQSGSRLFSEHDSCHYAYTRKQHVSHTEIILPENAPAEFSDREKLWNSAESVEKQHNAQLARRIIAALPVEMSREQYLPMVREYCMEQFVSKGMAVDFAIHDADGQNPHVHILLPLRGFDTDGTWQPKCRKEYVLDENGERILLPSGDWKTRRVNTNDWNNPSKAEVWRQGWADIQNRYLEASGREERVDLRSYERQGIEKIPTVHLGPAAHQMEMLGIHTDVGDLNRTIVKTNRLLLAIRNAISRLSEWIEDQYRKRDSIVHEMQTEQEHSLVDALLLYMSRRSEERADWSIYWQRQGTIRDINKINQAVEYLRTNGIYTIGELKARLSQVESSVNTCQGRQAVIQNRLNEIDMILQRYSHYKKFRPLYEEYRKIFFKIAKQKFYQAHKAELDLYFSSVRYVLRNGGHKEEDGRIIVPNAALKEERQRLRVQSTELKDSVGAYYDDLCILRDIRYYIDQVMTDNLQWSEDLDDIDAADKQILGTPHAERQETTVQPKSRSVHRRKQPSL